MPSAADVRKAFGFEVRKDGTFNGISYELADFKHVVVVANQKYKFPVKLVFLNSTKRAVLSALKRHCSGERIVNSAYGNPYKCTLKKFSATDVEDGKVVVSAMGVAIRDHDEGKKKDLPQIPMPLSRRGWRLIRSHFNTGKCCVCGEHIEMGSVIAKRNNNGRWRHYKCI